MRERKYVKFRVDMYDDTKFKIIDRRQERDLIHYVWNRIVVLAGKVNLEGELYLSKNMPYTIETLAIEFNRGTDEIKLAVDVLIELQMIEFTEYEIYMVKNFAKHQNIKTKEKIESKDNKIDLNNKEALVVEDLKDEINNQNKESENKISQNEVEDVKNDDRVNLKAINKDISKIDNNTGLVGLDNNQQNNLPIPFEMKKNKKANKKTEKENFIDVTDGETEDNSMFSIVEGKVEVALGKGERAVGKWSFGL